MPKKTVCGEADFPTQNSQFRVENHENVFIGCIFKKKKSEKKSFFFAKSRFFVEKNVFGLGAVIRVEKNNFRFSGFWWFQGRLSAYGFGGFREGFPGGTKPKNPSTPLKIK